MPVSVHPSFLLALENLSRFRFENLNNGMMHTPSGPFVTLEPCSRKSSRGQGTPLLLWGAFKDGEQFCRRDSIDLPNVLVAHVSPSRFGRSALS